MSAPYYSAAPAPKRPHLTLFIPRGRLSTIVMGSFAFAVALAPSYWDATPWLGLGIFLMAATLWHSMLATARIPWLPGAIIAIAGLQWVLAPWAAYHLPVAPLRQGMSIPPEQYFSFAVPSTVALAVGLLLPIIRDGRVPVNRTVGARVDAAGLRRTCDAMLVGGMLLRLAGPFAGVSAGYAVKLVAELAYVGALGSMLMQTNGWRMRVAALFFTEAILNSINGVYFELVAWSVHFFLLYSFVHGVRKWKIVTLGSAAVVAVLALNGFKMEFRTDIAGTQLTGMERAALAGQRFISMIGDPRSMFSPDNLAFNISRLNQGITISRVLYWTPSREPFANGETVRAAIAAAALPRALDPDKIVAGGFSYYPRFTGLPLIGGTSINLSMPGELYANFGVGGAIFGMFVIGLLLGLVFRTFVRWSRDSVLWWAWMPYVLFSLIGAESGIAESLNQVVKATLVMIVVIRTVPAWMTLRHRLRLRSAKRTGVGARLPATVGSGHESVGGQP